MAKVSSARANLQEFASRAMVRGRFSAKPLRQMACAMCLAGNGGVVAWRALGLCELRYLEGQPQPPG
eukprot:2739264-Pyramimonas_sp.AAC.1